MQRVGLDRLTAAQKRALLAERLRERSLPSVPAVTPTNGAALPRRPANEGRSSFLDKDVIELASLKDWKLEDYRSVVFATAQLVRPERTNPGDRPMNG